MTIHLPGATREPIPGVSPASFDHESNPTWKLLLHTTEGGSYSSARGSYRNNRFAPSVTVGPDPDRPQTVKAWEHVPLDSRSTTLADKGGSVRENRDYVVQVEIVGYCDKAYAQKHGPMWLYVHNWPDWYKAGVARILNQILDLVPIPRISTVTWRDYPQSAWKDSPIRLTSAAYDAYRGILGHQHASDNNHGDPGDLSVFVRDFLLKKPTQPPEDDDMAGITQARFNELFEGALDDKDIKKKVARAVLDEAFKEYGPGTGAEGERLVFPIRHFIARADQMARLAAEQEIPTAAQKAVGPHEEDQS